VDDRLDVRTQAVRDLDRAGQTVDVGRWTHWDAPIDDWLPGIVRDRLWEDLSGIREDLSSHHFPTCPV
jgi:hypothetical protein